MLTHAELLRLLSFDPATGIFTLLVDTPVRSVGRAINKDFLCLQKSGREVRKTVVFVWGHRNFPAGRLAWFYMTGEWPVSEVDHHDNDGWNQRWENLRLASRSQNQANTRCYRSNSLGSKGVYRREDTGRYRAMIQKDKRRISLGNFDTETEAAAAYAAAAANIHGEFARVA